MKIFWEILGTKKRYYTAKAVEYVIERKTGKKYYTGVGKMYKKEEYPKNLIENLCDFQNERCSYDFYYGVAAVQKPDRIEKSRQDIRHVYSSVHPKELEKEYLDFFGLWEIRGLNVYTDKAVDIIRDKKTGIEYPLGERKLFKNEDETPFPLAEHTDQYEFIYYMSNSGGLSVKDDLKEINSWFITNALFGK